MQQVIANVQERQIRQLAYNTGRNAPINTTSRYDQQLAQTFEQQFTYVYIDLVENAGCRVPWIRNNLSVCATTASLAIARYVKTNT